MKIRGFGVAHGVADTVGRKNIWNPSMLPAEMSPPRSIALPASKSRGKPAVIHKYNPGADAS